MEFGTVSAQSMMEEQLREVVVTGSLYADCDMCRGLVLRADLAYHKQNDCPARTVVCDICHVSYKAYEGHYYCNGNGYSGSGPSSGPSSGNSGTVGNSGNTSSGNSLSGNTWQIPNKTGQTVSVKELRDLKWKGVKLVGNPKLPDELHKQERKWECVIRAYAFMAEMKGYDYDIVFKTLDDIANKAGIDLDIKGIPKELVSDFFKEYCLIGAGNNTPSNVASFIDKGILVAAITCTEPYHMVTIIGYDNNNYYTASGDGSGKTTIYQKDQLNCHDYIYFFNRTKTPNR